MTENASVKFKHRTPVKLKAEAKYLGCWLTGRGDPNREVKQRLANCMTVFKKLDICWREASPNITEKLRVDDAVNRSKLLYGLEPTATNDTVKHKVDTFQLKEFNKM